MQVNIELEKILKYEKKTSIESCKTFAQQLRNKFGGQGFSLCLANKGKRVLHEGFGYHSDENPVNVDKNLKGNIASISKPFTSHAACKVEQNGSSGLLQEDIWKYIKQIKGDSYNTVDVSESPYPDVKVNKEANSNSINVWSDKDEWKYQLLLSNLSGWEHYYSGNGLVYPEESMHLNNLYKLSSKEKLMTMLDYKKLKVHPGEHFYSNNGFNLAGLILSQIKNENFVDLATREILDIGLLNTNYDTRHFNVPYGFFEPILIGIDSEKKQLNLTQQLFNLINEEYDSSVELNKDFFVSPLAKKQSKDFEAFNSYKIDFAYKHPSEGLASTVGDLQKFLDIYANMYHSDLNDSFTGPLSRSNFKNILTKHSCNNFCGNKKYCSCDGYAMGWSKYSDRLKDGRRVRVIGHDGLTDGFYSDAEMFITTNLQEDATENISNLSEANGVDFVNCLTNQEEHKTENYSCHTITGSLIWGQQGMTIKNDVSQYNVLHEFWQIIHSTYGT